jgi:hypothetical protein
MADDFWGLNLNLDDFDRLLKKDDLAEEPVPLEVFVRDRKFLGLEYDLSDIQVELARHITQIYKPETYVKYMGEEKGLEWYKQYNCNEVVAMLGKGSGKDYTSRVSMAYIVYLLHCLRDPIKYYGKGYGVTVDLINLAVNAAQAKNVFFEPLKKLLLRSPWFNEVGFEPRVSELFFFSAPIRCFSGHSESESWEGYEPMLIILDEIAAFKTDVELKSAENAQRAKGSASGIYNMSKVSVISRFPKVGKVVLLSFPRFKGDFITQRYKQAIENPLQGTYAVKHATWEVNPTITREDLEPEFQRNPVEAEARFNCNPPEMEDAYFREPELVRNAFRYFENPVLEDGTYEDWFNGTDGFMRFIHVDLGLKRDKTGLAMVHCSGLKEVQTSIGIEKLPIINVDFVWQWRAKANEEINFASVRDMITRLARKFSVGLISFDQWQSADMLQSLKSWGHNAEWHLVKKTDYDTLQTAIYDGRLRGFWDEQLVENELLKLKLINNNKIDHPATGEKDMADALAGAVFQCVTHIGMDQEVDIEIWNDLTEYSEEDDKINDFILTQRTEKEIPDDLQEWLFNSI